MPTGCSITCAAFETCSTILEQLAEARLGCPHVTHYLDDFLFVGPVGTDTCANCLAIFQALTGELEVPLAQDKAEGPTDRLTYLGIMTKDLQGSGPDHFCLGWTDCAAPRHFVLAASSLPGRRGPSFRVGHGHLAAGAQGHVVEFWPGLGAVVGAGLFVMPNPGVLDLFIGPHHPNS